uniref:Janus kinase and microtubule-interacting protein C-terminal domain-containing protein n=1 Tax=Strigamia maritima TaxID=126957 RepID=T1IIU9_STRMM
ITHTSDVEVNEEKNAAYVDLDQKTAGLRLLKAKHKNKMLSSCRSYSWRTKDLHLSAMTPIEEEEEDTNWQEEKKRLYQENQELKEKLWGLEQRQICLEVDLQEARDQNDLLEFRILEVEQTSNSECKKHDKCVNTDSTVGLIEDEVKSPVEDNLAERIHNLEAECNSLRIENKSLAIKLLSVSQMSASTQESITDSMFDNRSDVVSQGGETGYSSDEYEDMNANLSNLDVPSPTPSIDSATAVEFEDIVQKISGLNGENTISGNNFPGSLEELNSRNKTSRMNACNDFFWSLSEVAHKIKESEDVKNKLRAHVRSLEEELKRVINENEALKQEKSFDFGKKLDFNLFNKENDEKSEENVDLDSCGIEVIKNMLSEKERELHNKEVEYSLKMDAMKCDHDETVNRLENRLEISLKAEMEFREKIDTLEQEKGFLKDEIRVKDAECEMDKMTLMNQMRSLQQAKEKLEERIVLQTKKMGGKQLFSVSEEVYGDDAEERSSDKEDICEVGENAEESGDYNDKQNESQQGGGENKQLKQRLFELEKKERAYRETLHEADKIMADVERSYQERIDEQEVMEERLRARIVQLEQSEKRLRQALRNTKHNNEVSKFGELLDRLLETEASERRLKSRIHELEMEDKEIKKSLTDVQRDKYIMEQELQDQEELLRILTDLRQVEKELRSKIAQLETSEGALRETLTQADAILMEREMALKDKVGHLEAELMSLRQEKDEYEDIVRDQHPNRVQSMADVVNLNAKLELQVDELEEINTNLRHKLLQLESENTHLNKQNSGICLENNNDLCLKMNLEILERDYQIEKLSDRIKTLEAGNVPMELQALSLHADELKQLKEKINSLSAFV